jgi:SagB-type dehydrogenase family enzyme
LSTQSESPHPDPLKTTLVYHERSKHAPSRFAPSLGYLDWATQPDPFRRFTGAPLVPLDLVPIGAGPHYASAFLPGHIEPAPLDRLSISQLFQDALALSAWKQAGNSRWALRVNPSSGNLHPTEGYLIAGPIEGLHPRPAIYHYAPLEHALERRTDLTDQAWAALATQLPDQAVLIGLTSIHWRESWKYGERAFRYCHHDVGHAIGSAAIAAAGLGWQASLLESLTDDEVSALLGVQRQTGIEAEHPDCLLAVFPAVADFTTDQQRAFAVPDAVRDALGRAVWLGVPNELSRDHHPWPAIDEVSSATEKRQRPHAALWTTSDVENSSPATEAPPIPLRRVIHQRRSAVAFDGTTPLTRDAFFEVLRRVMPGSRQVPLTTLPWRPRVDLLLFVHRVVGLPPGLYALVRDAERQHALAHAMNRSWTWSRPEGCPAALPLFFLHAGDAQHVARQTSCDQDIASDGVFLAAMLAEYRPSLETVGPWFYRRLYWETGVIGQVLYLEAEAHGIRSTGIGCFFDDLTHRLFALDDDRFQVLYHFTMGGAVDDSRVVTLDAYRHLTR